MKIQVKSLLVLGLLVLATAGQLAAQTIQQALSLLDAEQFSKSKAMIEGLVTTSPTAENQFYMGYYLLRTDKPDLAKAAFEKGLAADPNSALNVVGQGALKLAAKDYAGGKLLIDKAIQMSKSKNADVLYRAAEAYTLPSFSDFYKDAANDPAEAVRLIDLIPERTKKTAPEYQIVKGNAWLIKNEGGPAVSAYEQALLLDPKNAKALAKIAVVYKRGKNYNESLNYFKKAIEADSNFAPIYDAYGDYFILGSKYKLAAIQFKKYIEKAEATPDNVIKTAKLLFLSKDYDGAAALISQAESKAKDDIDIPRMKGYILTEQGKAEEAVKILDDMVKKYPKDKIKPTDMSYLGMGMSKIKGREEEALKILGDAAVQDTTNNLFKSIHDIYYTKKDYKSAADIQRKAIAWQEGKKARTGKDEFDVKSGDYNLLGRDYYFISAFSRDTAKALREAARNERYKFALKSDSAFAKAVELNKGTYAPYMFWRARALGLADTSKTLWLAKPQYQLALETSDKATIAANKLNKEYLLETYKYFVAYYSISAEKDDAKAVDFAKKGLEIKPDDKDLQDLVNPPVPPAPGTVPPPGTPVKQGATPAPTTPAAPVKPAPKNK